MKTSLATASTVALLILTMCAGACNSGDEDSVPPECRDYAKLMATCFHSENIAAQVLPGFRTAGKTQEQVERLSASCRRSHDAMTRSCR